MGFIEELVDELREVFSIDKDFSEKKFEKQMAVVRGQALNLASAMRFGPNPNPVLLSKGQCLTPYIQRSKISSPIGPNDTSND